MHVLQPLDVGVFGVFRPWKHYYNKAIHHVLYSLDIIHTIALFFRDMSSICEQTFQPFTFKNSFKQSGMFTVSFKKAVKKMRQYNTMEGKRVATLLYNAGDNQEAREVYSALSVEDDGDIELPILPSSYFKSQKCLDDWVERAETFSRTSKMRFHQWAKETQVSLAQNELQQDTY